MTDDEMDAFEAAELLSSIDSRERLYFEQEGSSVYFKFEEDGSEWHFEVDFHSGNIWLQERVDGDWVTRLEHTSSGY